MCDFQCDNPELCKSCTHYVPKGKETIYLTVKAKMIDYVSELYPEGNFALYSDCSTLARKIFKKKNNVSKATLSGMKPIPSNFIKSQTDVDELFEIFKKLAYAYSNCLQK